LKDKAKRRAERQERDLQQLLKCADLARPDISTFDRPVRKTRQEKQSTSKPQTIEAAINSKRELRDILKIAGLEKPDITTFGEPSGRTRRQKFARLPKLYTVQVLVENYTSPVSIKLSGRRKKLSNVLSPVKTNQRNHASPQAPSLPEN
jgi:hypothetical protein